MPVKARIRTRSPWTRDETLVRTGTNVGRFDPLGRPEAGYVEDPTDGRAKPFSPGGPQRSYDAPFATGSAVRLSLRTLAILGGVLGILTVLASDQIVPATNEYQAEMRIWLVARAAGITAYLLLTTIVVLGLILSHPVNQSTWKLSRRLFPWHENLLVFVLAFIAAHVVSLVLDPYAGVGPLAIVLPGLSSYRSTEVALGALAFDALVITALTARYTKLLPRGLWLKIHRLSIVIWGLSWAHGILAGTDTDALSPMYVLTGLAVVVAAAYRYWVGKRQRPTFSTSLPDPATHTADLVAPRALGGVVLEDPRP